MTAPAPTAAAPPRYDGILWPLLDALRSSAAYQLGWVRRPVCAFDVYLADHPIPADQCTCTCADGGQGAAWVRVVGANTLLGVPGARPPINNSCSGTELLLLVEIGVHRCAPTLNGKELPTPAEYETYSRGIAHDLLALHRAFLCADWLQKHDIGWQLNQLTPTGPQGGCGGAYAQAQLVLGNCCPPPPTPGG